MIKTAILAIAIIIIVITSLFVMNSLLLFLYPVKRTNCTIDLPSLYSVIFLSILQLSPYFESIYLSPVKNIDNIQK